MNLQPANWFEPAKIFLKLRKYRALLTFARQTSNFYVLDSLTVFLINNSINTFFISYINTWIESKLERYVSRVQFNLRKIESSKAQSKLVRQHGIILGDFSQEGSKD